jgi:hypothetical protein
VQGLRLEQEKRLKMTVRISQLERALFCVGNWFKDKKVNKVQKESTCNLEVDKICMAPPLVILVARYPGEDLVFAPN